MSVISLHSAHIVGLEAHLVHVEVDVSSGMYSFSIVGLGDKAVEESKDRVVTALKNTQLAAPKSEHHKIVVSLAPADTKKEGSHFDVPIALGYLASSKKVAHGALGKKLFIGELGLNGEVRSFSGILPVTLLAKQHGFESIFVPYENREEAALVSGITVYGVKRIEELVQHLTSLISGEAGILTPTEETEITHLRPDYFLDFKDIQGQDTAKRALQIAAVGGHNIALYGAPGTGKTMLARAFTGILPTLSKEEIVEVTKIHSIAGNQKGLITHPPFRYPTPHTHPSLPCQY
jgi:magnesium chelatase family protein